MVKPILATSDPYTAVENFILSGWKLEFSNPPEEYPLVGISLEGNLILLGPTEERVVKRSDKGHIGAGVILRITVPAESLERVYKQHQLMKPSPIEQKAEGVRAFEVVIQGFRFMIAAEA